VKSGLPGAWTRQAPLGTAWQNVGEMKDEMEMELEGHQCSSPDIIKYDIPTYLGMAFCERKYNRLYQQKPHLGLGLVPPKIGVNDALHSLRAPMLPLITGTRKVN
jgi:hypothetical protein